MLNHTLTQRQEWMEACQGVPWPQSCRVKLWGPGPGYILGPKDENQHEEATWGYDKTWLKEHREPPKSEAMEPSPTRIRDPGARKGAQGRRKWFQEQPSRAHCSQPAGLLCSPPPLRMPETQRVPEASVPEAFRPVCVLLGRCTLCMRVF